MALSGLLAASFARPALVPNPVTPSGLPVASTASGALALPLAGGGTTPAVTACSTAVAASDALASPLVSSSLSPIALNICLLKFFWILGGEAGHVQVAKVVANLPKLPLHLPAEVGQAEVMDLIDDCCSFVSSHL
jgi:hypothetical protein